MIRKLYKMLRIFNEPLEFVTMENIQILIKQKQTLLIIKHNRD